MAIQTKNAKEIFVEAIEQYAPSQWPEFLNVACGSDTSLRKRVEILLKAHIGDESLLDRPAIAPAQTLEQPTERLGNLIGPYKLLEQIGEGGMGVVYVAEQTEPVRRRVALKIIKPGMDTKQVIARFEAERQALAMMDHPHIAKVLDAGTTDAGRPYFVMELVRGLPVTEYCDKARLSPRQRLELFIDVCHAVQHAHQKGVIHRDLKPSNVMITVHDGRPVAKVIDFGVAKAVGQQLTERTVYTAHTQLVGTPLYMSPEQADFSSQDVDTRSDVYSLGVLLYELLTGQTPFDKETLTKAGFDEMRRIIREDEPPCPSRRFSTLSAQASSTVSQHRSVDQRHLGRVLRGELDWIVMKALDKDRSRRYESASALATDIQRYLSDEPVLACPPTTMYRFQKFARKHKPALATAAVIAASLILGTTVSAWQAVRATTAEAQATANEQKANANAAQAQEKAHEANTQRDEAQRQRNEVRALNEKLQAAQAEQRSTLYAAHMVLAQRAWDAGAISRVIERLEKHRPKPGETDLRGFEWHYLYKLCHPELLTLKGRNKCDYADHCVAFSPDGRRLAFGHTAWNEAKKSFSAGEVKVWDSQTGQELLSLKGHTGGITSVAFSSDGRHLASASFDKSVKVWDAQTGKELLTFTGHAGIVTSVAFSPDGKRLASATDGVHHQGKWIPDSADVKVWNPTTGEVVATCKGHSGTVWCVSFSPDGKRLASGSGDGVKVCDAQTGTELFSLQGHNRDVISVAFSPDGKRLFSGAYRSGVKVWDAQTGQESVTLKGLSGVMSVSPSPDGKRLAVALSNSTKIVDAETGDEILSLNGHTSWVLAAVFNHDGTKLASASDDGTVRVWDASTRPGTAAFSGLAGTPKSVSFSPDGKRVIGATLDPMTKEQAIKVWDARTGQEFLSIKPLTGKALWRVTISPDGRLLAAAFGNTLNTTVNSDNTTKEEPGEVKLWDAQTGAEVVTFKGHIWPVVDVTFSPDSARVVSCGAWPNGGSRDRSDLCEVKVWDPRSGRELLALTGHKNFVNSVSYSPDGKRVATLSRDKTLKVWDAQTGQELVSFPAPDSQIGGSLGGSVVFSPDGKRIATNSNMADVTLWDIQTGKKLLTFQGHVRRITSLAFSPDGKRLASGTGGSVTGGWLDPRPQANEAKLWDTQTGEELLTFGIIGGGGVAFSLDGNQLVTAGPEGLKIYDATPLPEKP